MWIVDFLIYAPIALVVLYVVIIYNGLVRLRNNIDRCFANIEVVLKQRHSEVPRLVEVCKGIMKHEKTLFSNIAEARERVRQAGEDHDIRELGHAETQIRQAVYEIFSRAEAYPELKSNENMLELQERISALEDMIADRREVFNESVRLNNTRIAQLPDLLLARLFRFVSYDYLRFESQSLQSVTISSLQD